MGLPAVLEVFNYIKIKKQEFFELAQKQLESRPKEGA